MILHADLDAFYAAVAQRDDPSLRGKAIAVSGSSRRAVVLTASYEARPYGVRSAMPLFMALERCPELIVVRPDFEKYRAASKTVFEILRAHAQTVEGMSLDEAFLDVGDISLEDASAIGRAIKEEVRAATSLTISIGVAANKMVAKVASDEGKPDGLVAVAPGAEREYLRDKPVGRLWGIGPKTQARLRDKGIERIDQIASMGDEQLAELFGRWGKEVRDLARGTDRRRVVHDESVRSISSEETFEHDTSDLRVMIPIVREQARELAARLQKNELCAYTVGVKMKRADFTITGRQTTLVQPTDDARIIAGAAVFCLRHASMDDKLVRLIGVRVSSLVPRGARQMPLFG